VSPQGGQSDVEAGRLDALKAEIRRTVADRLRERGTRWYGMADLRDDIGDRYTATEFDEAVRDLARNDDTMRVIPVANRKALGQRDHDAAVKLGDDELNAITVVTPDTDEPAPTPTTPNSRANLVGKNVTGAELRVGDVIEGLRGNPRTVDSVADGRAHLEGGGYTIAGSKYKVISVADEPAAPRAEPLDTSRAKRDDGDMTTAAPKMTDAELAAAMGDIAPRRTVKPARFQPEQSVRLIDEPDAQYVVVEEDPAREQIRVSGGLPSRRGNSVKWVSYGAVQADEQTQGVSGPTLGVRETSAGRETTVTLPDGTVAKRTSKTKEYTHAVVATTDLHATAARMRREADRVDEFLTALKAWQAAGADPRKLTRKRGSVSSYGQHYSLYVPGFEDQMPLPDQFDTTGHPSETPEKMRESWEKYGPNYVAQAAVENAAKLRKQADELAAGPQFGYNVWRWSQSATNAFKAIGEFTGGTRNDSAGETRYEVITVGGVAVHKDVKVNTGPTAEEKAAAKLAKAEIEKADRAKRNEEWVQRKVADIRAALAEGSPERARSQVTSTNDQGLRMIGREFGIKSTPRGMGDRQKTEWLRNEILDRARKPRVVSGDDHVLRIESSGGPGIRSGKATPAVVTCATCGARATGKTVAGAKRALVHHEPRDAGKA
jgi:hypothetical protein